MNVVIIGSGYVGLVTGTCFSEMGVNVACVDIDKDKINKLKKGIVPIYEPGLDEMILRNIGDKRLFFTTNIADCINTADVIFIAVGTPPDEDGSADLKYVLECAKSIGELITDYKVIVTKSTVPVGTSIKVKSAINDALRNRGIFVDFDVVSNPEFLKEGSAIEDFMKPDRVVVGVESERAEEIMARLYKPFMMNRDRLVITDVMSSEMIKYAANSMLATRISFMNEIANLCEKVGANVDMVRKGIGSDTRIGSKFLYSGCGYGGSCFPKDVKALIKTAQENGVDMKILQSVEDVNDKQKIILFNKLYNHFEGDLQGKKIALWGLAFKPETDDMREAPSIEIIEKLIDAKAIINAYDPIAMGECRRIIGNTINYFENKYDTLDGADALIVVTEWKEFRILDINKIKAKMNTFNIFDGRNIYNRKELESNGFYYTCIGK